MIEWPTLDDVGTWYPEIGIGQGLELIQMRDPLDSLPIPPKSV